MRKFLIVYACVLFAIVSRAAQCQFCRTTMPLREFNGRVYCTKHFCAKHKVVNSSGVCEQCKLESLIARGKGGCKICALKNAKELLILSEGWHKWGIYCKAHYCDKHHRIFSKLKDGEYACYTCQAEEKKEKAQEEFERKKREWHEAREKERAEVAQKEKEYQKAQEEERAAHNLFMSTALDSLFGVRLGGQIPLKVSGVVESKMQTFVPAKKFRNFETYSYRVENGRITEIQAVAVFDDLDAMKQEFDAVISVMDRKYGKGRRGVIRAESLDEFRCKYDFGCNPETGEDVKQRLAVYTRIVPQTLKYRIVICAYLVDAANAAYEKEQQRDMDAL